MPCWPTSGPGNWPRVTDANAALVSELERRGLVRREARWLVQEYGATDDPSLGAALFGAAQRRLSGEPLQYVIGHWPFRDLDLDIDARVLIPRPETEELVGVALDELARSAAAAPRILDLGCGSGAIGLALLDELGRSGVAATLVSVDSSLDALDVARTNAQKHQLDAVSFVHSSWFDDLDGALRGRFDLIVANPPYVGRAELGRLDPVLAYEPEGALVADDARGVAGFADVERIIVGAPAWLAPAGVLVCEHGDRQGDAATSLATSSGFATVEDRVDVAARPRLLVARRS